MRRRPPVGRRSKDASNPGRGAALPPSSGRPPPEACLAVRLKGGRLDGVWTRIPARLGGDPKNWLLMRKREDGTAPGAAPPAPAERYLPMRAAGASRLPAGPGWGFEVHWVGERAL